MVLIIFPAPGSACVPVSLSLTFTWVDMSSSHLHPPETQPSSTLFACTRPHNVNASITHPRLEQPIYQFIHGKCLIVPFAEAARHCRHSESGGRGTCGIQCRGGGNKIGEGEGNQEKKAEEDPDGVWGWDIDFYLPKTRRTTMASSTLELLDSRAHH